MFRCVCTVLVLVFLLPRGASAFGGNGASWIVSGGTSAGLNIQTGSPQTTRYDIRVGIGHALGESLELLLLGSHLSLNTQGLPASSNSEIDGQLNLIVGGDHADAFYLGPRIGSQFITRSGASSSQLVMGGAIGKRFPLGAIVSFAPEVAVTVIEAAGTISTPDFDIVPLQFALVF